MLVLQFSMPGFLGSRNALNCKSILVTLFFLKGNTSPNFVTIYIEFIFLSHIFQILGSELSLVLILLAFYLAVTYQTIFIFKAICTLFLNSCISVPMSFHVLISFQE